MLPSHPPRPPAYVIGAGTLCRGIPAFCRSRAIHAGDPTPAAALLDGWLEDDAPTFEWVYSDETLVIYETVLRRLEVSSRFVDRVIGSIRQMGLRAVTPLGAGDPPSAIEEAFRAAAEAVEEAAIVTPDRAAAEGRAFELSLRSGALPEPADFDLVSAERERGGLRLRFVGNRPEGAAAVPVRLEDSYVLLTQAR